MLASNTITTVTNTAAPTFTNTTASLGASFGLTLAALAIIGALQDFEKGLKMKYKALTFNIGEIIGLKVFCNLIFSVPIKAIASDAISSIILSIIIVFVGIEVTIYLERRSPY